MTSLRCIAIKTRVLTPPKDDLFAVLDESLPQLQERDVRLITSKVLAIHQGRCIPAACVQDKDELIRQEAELFISRSRVPGKHAVLTIKNNTLIPSAGIDESNGNGYYILWPHTTQKLLTSIWRRLRRRHGVRDLGVIATDSHTTPLRYGVTGVSIGHIGFHPLDDKRGSSDLFGRALECTTVNIPDALAAAGVFCMGESDEQTPLALIRGVRSIHFTKKDTRADLTIPPDEDIYKPLLANMKKSQ